jgi:heptosyltransferase II
MQRILIIAPQWIGDAVMSLPLLNLIKQNFSNSIIDVLCTPWVAPIYKANPDTTNVIKTNFQHRSLQLGLRLTTAQNIKAMNYTMAFVLPNSFKSALIPWLAGIPKRIGYRGELRFGLINNTLPNPSRQVRTPMAEHYAQLLNTIQKLPIDLRNLPTPRLEISEESARETNQQLAPIANHPFYVFAPGAEYGPAKRWPSDHYAQLAQQILASEPNSHIVILGSQNDHVVGHQIQTHSNHANRIQNWCGQISLDQSIAVIAKSRCLISNDSGLMHIGAALSVPQVAIFGSSNPKHTPPLSKKAQVVWLGLSCSPCYERNCPLGHLNCLNEIKPERIYAMLSNLKSN